MKTAKEYLEHTYYQIDEFGNKIYHEKDVLSVMRYYAKQVAEQSLLDALSRVNDDYVYIKDYLITETPIQLP